MKKLSDFTKHVVSMCIFVDCVHIILTCGVITELSGLHIQKFSDFRYALSYCCIPVSVLIIGLAVAIAVFCKNDGFCPIGLWIFPYVLEAITMAVIVGMVQGRQDKAAEALLAGVVHGITTLFLKDIFSVIISLFDDRV